MNTVLILHGITGNSQENWFPWLKKELEQKGYEVICPDLPKTDHPDRQEWLHVVKDLLQNTNHFSLTIVGHSLGVATALDYLEQSDKSINTLISAAGFYQNYGMELNSYFMAEKDIDISSIKPKVKNIHILYGDNDPYVPQKTLQNLADAFEVKPQIFKNGGHLNANAGFKTFPQLLDIITND